MNLPTWAIWCLAIFAIWCFLAACAYLMHLMGISFGYPCANPKCKETLAHADYTSMYCYDCRHLDTALQADPMQRHYRTQAAYSGDWSKVK